LNQLSVYLQVCLQAHTCKYTDFMLQWCSGLTGRSLSWFCSQWAGMMKLKLKTFLFVVFVTTTLMGLSITAQAQIPQSCYDGDEYLGSKKYKKSIDKLTACLRSGSHTKTSRALAYYNRAEAYTYLYDEEVYVKENFKKADKLLIEALDDIHKSIELDPTGNAKAYCLSGYLHLEESWGFYGYDDLDKGIAMGAPKDLCGL